MTKEQAIERLKKLDYLLDDVYSTGLVEDEERNIYQYAIETVLPMLEEKDKQIDKLKKHNDELLKKLRNRVKEVKKLQKYSLYKEEFSRLNKQLQNKDKIIDLREKLKSVDIAKESKDLDIGELTLKDIVDELSKPGRDPRDEMPKPILRQDVLKFEDLKEGMILPGTVRNVIDFGAFVDIGVKYDGLVHISEMSDKYIKNPSELVSVGDIVKVKVIKIDMERHKVGLSMKI